MSDRPCIRGCTARGGHFAACPDFGKEDGECRGCRPKMARAGALICEGCYRRLRRYIDDAADLIGHIRSIADPTKSGWNFDKLRVSSARPDLPAPVAADLVDASNDLMRTLRDWAVHVDGSMVGRRGLWAGADSGEAYDEALRCSEVILEEFDKLANRVEIVEFADAVMHRHQGDPEWWSFADAQSRYSLDDRPRWATLPCPECDIKTVRVIPPRRVGQGFKYVCETCEWEANDGDDGGLWAQVFSADQVVSVTPHDPRWLTLSQAARVVSRTVGTVRGWVSQGLLEPRLGRYWRPTVESVARAKRGEGLDPGTCLACEGSGVQTSRNADGGLEVEPCTSCKGAGSGGIDPVGTDYSDRGQVGLMGTEEKLEAALVVCRGCGATIARFDDQGLGAARTEHDQACPSHSFAGRCAHEGACYERVPVQQDRSL